VIDILHEANVRQHFTNDLDSTVPNDFVLCQESLEEVAEHSCHEAVGDGVFFFVSAFSSDLLIGCKLVRLVGVCVWVKVE
jgi:hypothetical protein